ncbi:hypothetical protein NLG97_g7191 [Lecanicillium saksenae]|uniref:Uncharacterized protein n=1 Tax=Lecanicillium saksenae TaxID=468837 RepID=A0ACC1QMI5_9HYPO|nr:hypothetical protein NLG97_g7191 [Lecanicillium saksenae]
MLRSTIASFAVVALGGFATAKDCTPGLIYCGHSLYAKGNYDFIIQQSFADSGVGNNDYNRNQANFLCLGNPYYGYVQFKQVCSRGCVDAGAGENDYCA